MIKAPKKFEERFPKLQDLLSTIKTPTLVYCPSPEKAETVAIELARKSEWLGLTNAHEDAIRWIESNIHVNWSFAACLRKGIGFHHGRLPRYLAKYLVRSFNEGNIRFLVCTSTLMEGVNTTAKNVVVYEAKKGSKKLDSFDFANISGRSGRMGHYVTGKVYSFDPPPPQVDVAVDFPWYTQLEVPDEVLIQMKREDLTPSSRERVEQYVGHHLLSVDVIRRNSNIPPASQLALAEYIESNLDNCSRELFWVGVPTWEQLRFACELIWNFFVVSKKREAGASSGSSLAFIVNRYQRLKSPNLIIADILRREPGMDVDLAVRECMEQIKIWCEFKFPKLLLVLESIQGEVLSKHKLPRGSYRFYATSIEHSFLPPAFAALREMGVPSQLAQKIRIQMGGDPTVDEVVRYVRRLLGSGQALDAFERRLLVDV